MSDLITDEIKQFKKSMANEYKHGVWDGILTALIVVIAMILLIVLFTYVKIKL